MTAAEWDSMDETFISYISVRGLVHAAVCGWRHLIYSRRIAPSGNTSKS